MERMKINDFFNSQHLLEFSFHQVLLEKCHDFLLFVKSFIPILQKIFNHLAIELNGKQDWLRHSFKIAIIYFFVLVS